jgi:hypothetical protein
VHHEAYFDLWCVSAGHRGGTGGLWRKRPQTNGGLTGAKRDASPVTGTDATVFRQRGWQPGDQKSWAQQLKARAQYGMNDYSRTTN